MHQNDQSGAGPWIFGFALLGIVLMAILVAGPRFGARSRPAIARLELSKTGTTQIASHPIEPISDPYAIQTEFERIRSDRVLAQVLANLRNLPGFAEHTRISPDAPTAHAIAQLRDLTSIRQARNTALIEIRAYAAHPQTAADIANEIANVYIITASTNGIQARLIDRAMP